MMKGTKMKKSAILSVLILGLVGALAATPAFAGPVVLYDNTTAQSDTYDAWTIYSGLSVSDSFALSQASTITGATFDIWLFSGDSLSSVDWSIGTTEFDTSLGSATASTTSSGQVATGLGSYPIYGESISIPDLSLGAGTYWFTLQNAVTAESESAYWDMSNGPSIAYENTLGNVNGWDGNSGSNSETFQILGSTGPVVPEPSSFLLLGSGLAGLAGLLKRKFRA
jgi:hypothetical protein